MYRTKTDTKITITNNKWKQLAKIGKYKYIMVKLCYSLYILCVFSLPLDGESQIDFDIKIT